MDTSGLMKQTLSSDNSTEHICKSYEIKVPREDGMKYTELKEHLVKDGEIIKEQLRTRKYKPQPVRRVEILKARRWCQKPGSTNSNRQIHTTSHCTGLNTNL